LFDTTPLISIVVPTWNRPQLVARLAEEINAADSGNDIEIVIVDNYSTQDTWNKLQKLESCNSRIRLFRNDENIGMTKNWNKAIMYARGEWIGMICDDDRLKLDSIRRIRRFIPTCTDPCLILQNSTIKSDAEWVEAGHYAANRVGLPPASGQFWHRNVTKELGGFDERIKYCPDAEFWLRVAFHYPVLMVRDYLIVPIQHDTNYMWEAFRSSDFLEQVKISIELSSQWVLDKNEIGKKAIQAQIDDGIWETLRTVLNNTFLLRGKMKYFKNYLLEFIRYSFLLHRKKLMVKAILQLPILRIKDFIRSIASERRGQTQGKIDI